MSVQIVSASLESHQEDLIRLFRRYLTPESDENRFNWLYKQSPYGRALAWVASDTKKGSIVGAAAAFPRKFYFQGTEKMGWVLGDFCLAEQYRSMGPALKLQRACLQAVDPPYDICYDFPSKPMMAVYRRLGLQQTTSLVRWAKPLRVDKLKAIVRSEALARTLGKIGSAVLTLRGWKGTKKACEIELHEGPCGEEFTSLDQSLRTIPALRPARTAAYLNWRYLAHPSGSHLILVARKKGRALAGYVVIRSEPENARIADLASLEEPAVIARLIDAAVRVLRANGAKTVSLVAGDGHPWSKIFERAGFRRRESSPIVVVSHPGATIKHTDFQTQCYLMEGERDS
jgi:hypothetical protein